MLRPILFLTVGLLILGALFALAVTFGQCSGERGPTIGGVVQIAGCS